MLIKKTFEALPSGGRIVIYDFFLDRGVIDNYLFSLHMQLGITGRQCFFKEMEAWLTAAGFEAAEIRQVDKYNDVVIARKP